MADLEEVTKRALTLSIQDPAALASLSTLQRLYLVTAAILLGIESRSGVRYYPGR